MIRTIDIDSIDDEHPAKALYGLVSDVLSDVEGWDVDLVSRLEGPEGTGITLQMSEDVDHLIRSGSLPFTLERHLDGYFGESTGSANVTTLRLDRQLNLRETIEKLSAMGQLEDARGAVDEMWRHDSDPTAEVIVAYAIAQYTKGWFAEEIIENNLAAKKGSVSQDEGGIDFFLEGEPVQIGSITRYNSNMTEMSASETNHLVYQWTHNGELVLGEAQEMLEKNKEIASDAGVSATLIRRSSGDLKINREVGRSFRYLWW